MRLKTAVISHGEILLGELLKFAYPADATVSRYFRANKEIGQFERGVLAEGVYAVLRNKTLYGQLAESGQGGRTRRMLLLGLADTLGAENLAGAVGAGELTWLVHVATIDATSLANEARWNVPAWLQSKLFEQLGAETLDKLCAVLNTPAPLDTRTNTLKATRDSVLSQLATLEIAASVTPFAPNGVRFAGKPALNRLALFERGELEVQDEGSQLLAHLVAPKRSEMVADFCAGAGGKTLALGALMRNTGRLYAFDVSDKRLAKLKPRLARSGLSNVHPVAIDSELDPKLKRLAGKFDRVLVDAPCSGFGTLRRNPDLKWRQNEGDIVELAAKQLSILKSAARMVKPRGRLVYATCSLLAEENQQVVHAFLADANSGGNFTQLNAWECLQQERIEVAAPDNAGLNLQLLPHLHQTDGFFAAVFEKRPQSTVAKSAKANDSKMVSADSVQALDGSSPSDANEASVAPVTPD